jgi:hypothetical protein
LLFQIIAMALLLPHCFTSLSLVSHLSPWSSPPPLITFRS